MDSTSVCQPDRGRGRCSSDGPRSAARPVAVFTAVPCTRRQYGICYIAERCVRSARRLETCTCACTRVVLRSTYKIWSCIKYRAHTHNHIIRGSYLYHAKAIICGVPDLYRSRVSIDHYSMLNRYHGDYAGCAISHRMEPIQHSRVVVAHVAPASVDTASLPAARGQW